MAARKTKLPAMLARMERVLERALTAAETAFDAAGAAEAGAVAAKNCADLMAQIVRTIEKIHELKKAIAVEADAAGTGELSRAERDALRQRVEEWIDRRAEERAARILAVRAGDTAPEGTAAKQPAAGQAK